MPDNRRSTDSKPDDSWFESEPAPEASLEGENEAPLARTDSQSSRDHLQTPPSRSQDDRSDGPDIDKIVSTIKAALEPLIVATARIRQDNLNGTTSRTILLTYICIGIVAGIMNGLVTGAVISGENSVGEHLLGAWISLIGGIVFPSLGLLIAGMIAFVIVVTYKPGAVKDVLLTSAVACALGQFLFLTAMFSLVTLQLSEGASAGVSPSGFLSVITLSSVVAGLTFGAVAYTGTEIV
ncbi:hypothetical protein [Halocatena halophila]|uniref:hypothetical protein n=1 Tax=Halocatena halophila TaxID=2814576 RepID=UPI002ED53473